MATQKGFVSIVQCLISSGAHINALDGVSNLYKVRILFVILYLLMQYEATSLHYAVQINHGILVQYLVTSGADIDAIGHVSFSIFHQHGLHLLIQVFHCNYV